MQFNSVVNFYTVNISITVSTKKSIKYWDTFFDGGLSSSTDESLETPLPITINALCMGTVDEVDVSILCSFEGLYLLHSLCIFFILLIMTLNDVEEGDTAHDGRAPEFGLINLKLNS